MALAVKFTRSDDGACAIEITGRTDGYSDGIFGLPQGSSLNVDSATDTFRVTCPGLSAGITFAKAAIDKAGSSPALTESNTGPLYYEMNNAFFAKTVPA